MQYSLVAILLAGAAVASPVLEARSGAQPPICTKLKTPPKGSICNKKGSLTKAAVLSHPNVYMASTCANVCGGTAACKSWSYDPNADLVCTLYKSTLTAQGFKASASSTAAYSDKTCATCKACTQNTFTNGDFASGSLSPWGCYQGDAGYSCSVTTTANGNNAAEIIPADVNESTEETSEVQFIQNFELCLGHTYTIGFNYSIGDATPENALSVTFGSQQIFQKQDFTSDNQDSTRFTTTVTKTLDNDAGINFDWINFNSQGSTPLLISAVTVDLVS